MSAVSEYVEERQNVLQDEANRSKEFKRVTVRLTGHEYAMLVEVAAALKDTKTGCAEELLGAAVGEAWREVGYGTTEDVQRVLSHYQGEERR